MSFLKEQYRLAFSFLRGDLRHYVRNTTIAFLVIYLVSLIGSILSPSVQDSLLAYIMNVIENANISDEQGNISAINICINNLRAAGFSIFYGIVPFLFLPALPIGLNASVLGAVTASYWTGGRSMAALFAGLVPHCIFELPALFIAFACGLYLCQDMTQSIRKKDEIRPPFSQVVKNLLRVYLTIIVPLLVVASFIEAYITPICMSFFL